VPLKKSLSQHLLKDRNLLNKLVRLAGISPGDTVVEIGAGRGDLTRCIAPQAHVVYAIELDKQFKEVLESTEKAFSNVKIIFGNVLNVPFRPFVKRDRIKVMGNIPYNITGDILFKLLSDMEVVESAHLTMQKEVGERLASMPCSRAYGALSVIFQTYASVKILMKLKPSLFVPPPEVESVFVSIIFNRSVSRPDQELIDFIKACFRYKRKYLKRSLEELLGRDRVQPLYEYMKFKPSIRAEELPPEAYGRMHAFLKGGMDGDGAR
jgi:16S rRNA (adenine1518-N6/adenine1519-N6)-dimethyltransferase